MWDDVACVVVVDEAFPAVVDEPAVDVGALLPVLSVVLLPSPERHNEFHQLLYASTVG